MKSIILGCQKVITYKYIPTFLFELWLGDIFMGQPIGERSWEVCLLLSPLTLPCSKSHHTLVTSAPSTTWMEQMGHKCGRNRSKFVIGVISVFSVGAARGIGPKAGGWAVRMRGVRGLKTEDMGLESGLGGGGRPKPCSKPAHRDFVWPKRLRCW